MKIRAFIITLILTVISLVHVAAEGEVPLVAGPILNPGNGHYYYLLESDTWENSEARAVSLGGHLVTINDDVENQWVVDTFSFYGEFQHALWIGLTDRNTENAFHWVSGQSVSYRNWNALSYEPNNSGGAGYEEDYTYIVERDSGNPTLLATFWNDAPDNGAAVAHPVYGVVEVELPPLAGPILNPTSGHVYYLLDSDTWSNSEARAVSLGGHLVTINNARENQWVFDTFAHYGGVSRALWIGLTDRGSEGHFRWASRKPITYRNWNHGTHEPNNSGGGGYQEDFAYMIEDDYRADFLGSFWNDAPNNHGPAYGIVEINPPIPVYHSSTLCWETLSGVRYQAQWKAGNIRDEWHDLGPPVAGTGEEACVEGAPGPRSRFRYRVIFVESVSVE